MHFIFSNKRGFKFSYNLFRNTFFDKIEEFISYPANLNGTESEDSSFSDHSFGVANGELIMFTFDYSGI